MEKKVTEEAGLVGMLKKSHKTAKFGTTV